VPISVIAAFKKIKALVHNNSTLATALRTSSKLVSFCRIFFLFKSTSSFQGLNYHIVATG
jgi:hypothetical protein